MKSDNIKITDKDLESFQTTNNIKSASKAAAFIGQMYWRGEGVEANDIEARKWYQRSAKLVRLLNTLYIYIVYYILITTIIVIIVFYIVV